MQKILNAEFCDHSDSQLIKVKKNIRVNSEVPKEHIHCTPLPCLRVQCKREDRESIRAQKQ